jgi:hypothetical protein
MQSSTVHVPETAADGLAVCNPSCIHPNFWHLRRIFVTSQSVWHAQNSPFHSMKAENLVLLLIYQLLAGI